MPFDPIGFQAKKNQMIEIVNFIKKQVFDHKEAINYSNPEDFIDSFLVEMKRSADTDESTIFTGMLQVNTF